MSKCHVTSSTVKWVKTGLCLLFGVIMFARWRRDASIVSNLMLSVFLILWFIINISRLIYRLKTFQVIVFLLFPCFICTKFVYEYFYKGWIPDFNFQSMLDLTVTGRLYSKNISLCWQMSGEVLTLLTVLTPTNTHTHLQKHSCT